MEKVQSESKGLIRKGEEYLVIEKEFNGQNLIDLPGDRVEKDEGPYDALIRKVKEELSLNIRIVEPMAMWWYYPEEGVKSVCNTFLCEPENENSEIDKKPESDIKNYYWMTKDELKRIKDPVEKSLIRVFRQF
ncbi:MAG: NUDIX domain-containing protein [Candidatus Pacearchaeota archaeon]